MNHQTLADRLKTRSLMDEGKPYIATRQVNISPMSRESHMVKLDDNITKPISEVPVRIDKLPSNLHLLASNPGGQTSLIPVIVSGDEIFHIQPQQTQNNVYVLSSPTVSDTDSVSGHHGNQNYISSSSVTSQLETDLTRHSARSQTGFLGYNINALDHNTLTSTSPGLNAVMTSSKATGAQSVASPVYKSKLEKAVAQNLLMQNMSKDSSSVQKPLPSVSIAHSIPQSSLTVQPTAPQPRTSFTNIKSSQGREPSLTTNSYIPDPILDEITSLPETRHSFSPSKPQVKISKVAEYYKNLISGKIPLPPISQSHNWKQSYEVVHPRTSSQNALVAEDNYLSDNQQCIGTFNGVNSFENEMAISADPSLLNLVVSEPEIVKEKTYTNIQLGISTLEALWKLREEGILCDAVLLAENEQIKLHRLVLIGASAEMYTQRHKAMEPELRLVLPKDFMVEHVMTFVYYIYHGVLNLSVHNVQQIYRLSAIFGMGQLSKYCYDFCKLAKMGHLIIDSPYQENAKQIRKTGDADDDLIEQTSPSKAVDSHHHVTSSVSETLTTPPNTAAAPMPQSSTEATLNVDTFDALNTEINWSKSEQSNIPIRKRGRTRKTTPNSIVKNSEDNKSKAYRQDNFLEDIATLSHSINLSGKLNATESVNKYEGGRLEIDTGAQYCGNMLAQTVPQEEERLDAASTEGKTVNDNQEIVYEQFPDPLLSGKLDENELNKVERHDDKNNMMTANNPSNLTTTVPCRPEGFQTPQSQKAKTTVIGSTPKLRRRKVAKKVPKNQEPEKIHSEIRRILSNPNVSLTSYSKLSKELETVRSSAIAEPQQDVSESKKEATSQLVERVGPKKNVDKDKTEQMKIDSANRENITQDTEASETDPPLPKKARLRKSTLDRQEIRDSHVYMRPPPKKRTKEIREMMKNEEDGILTHKDIEDNTKNKTEKNTGIKQIDKNCDKSSRKLTPKKRQRMKNDALMAKVYEIEKMAVDIEGEKVYRCTYCSVEFKFAKRAVTHLIGTHSVYLDDTPYLVSVEMKREESKDEVECEVCGYKPKESGSYYIHYHRYFRHQIPLPKGWQAYKCDLCQKEFFTKFQLREHKLIHFEDNPFVCEQCGSGFRSRTCLNSHVFHKHNSIRKHKCTECPKTFKTATQMKVHQRIHTGEKPFSCPSGQCPYRSTTRGNMKLHLTSKHKLNPTSVKKLMELLEASDGFVEEVEPETIEGPTVIYNEPPADLQVITNETGHETVPFDILVESTAIESDVTSKRLQGVADHIGSLNKPDTNVAVFNETVADNNAVVLNNRDYSSVTHGNLQGHDLDMVMQDGQILETQNIPRHVQILIQDAHRYMQHQQECPPNSQFVPDFQHTGGSESQDGRTRFSDQVVTPQTYEPTQRFMDNVPSQGTSDIIDPHSKEARMIIKEAFSSNLDRSLLKSAMQAGRLEPRHMQDNSSIPEHELIHNEAEKLVKEVHEQQIVNTVSQEDDVVRSLRTQIQQLREYGRSYPLDDQGVQEILLQNITSQQSMDPSNFPGYHHATISPPAYSSSGHGILSLSGSGVVAPSNVVMATTSPDEGQGQVQQLPSVMQGQGYSTVTSQPASGQYGADGNIYQGYYQEQQYDIENY